MARKNKKPIHIRDIIQAAIGTQFRSSDSQLLQLWDIWEQAVGDMIAQNARPSAFNGKLLIVEVSDSSWLHQLGFLKEEMKININNALKQNIVEEIKFKIAAF